MEELVDSVLTAANPKLRERCDGQKILSVFDTIGIYDVDGLRAMLTVRYDAIEARLEQDDAAPPTFLAQLKNHWAAFQARKNRRAPTARGKFLS